jgi:hypothetical protein
MVAVHNLTIFKWIPFGGGNHPVRVHCSLLWWKRSIPRSFFFPLSISKDSRRLRLCNTLSCVCVCVCR